MLIEFSIQIYTAKDAGYRDKDRRQNGTVCGQRKINE